MLQAWADEWGVTHERVRQLRIESGVPQRGAYNEEIAEAILDIIRQVVAVLPLLEHTKRSTYWIRKI